MNASHDAAHARALHRLSQPIPRPAVDDTAPDLVLGVIDYKYSMRPAWRVAVAQALGVPPAAVKLSVAWHARLPRDFMAGMAKAVGVTIDPSELPRDSPLKEASTGSGDHESKKREALAGLVERVLDGTAVELNQLGVTRAAIGADVLRHTTGGQVTTSVADVVRTASAEALVTILVAGAADLTWVSERALPRLVSSRVDARVVVMDDPQDPQHGAIQAALRRLIDDHAGAGRPLPGVTSSGGDSASPTPIMHEVKVGDSLPLASLVASPTLCIRGEPMAAGRFAVAQLLQSRKRMTTLVYRPDDVSYATRRNRPGTQGLTLRG